MPFFTVVGALSDKIGRKKLMMAGCLLGVLTYIPIYKAMERAAGNNVVTVKSTRNKVTGAIALTAMTTDATGALVPVKEAAESEHSPCWCCWCLCRFCTCAWCTVRSRLT
jgi:MFS family permease